MSILIDKYKFLDTVARTKMAEMKHSAFKVLFAYVMHYGDDKAYPSIRRIQKFTGMSKQGIMDARDHLVELGLIKVAPKPGYKTSQITIPLLDAGIGLSHSVGQTEVSYSVDPECPTQLTEVSYSVDLKQELKQKILNSKEDLSIANGQKNRTLKALANVPLSRTYKNVQKIECTHQNTSHIKDYRTGGTHLFCKSCNNIVARDIPVEKNQRRSLG